MQKHKVSKKSQIDKEKFEQYYESKNVDLRNEIVESHLYMVDILIRKYIGKGIERDDLYQVGAMALISAVERYDPYKGFAFSSFAAPTILGEIKKYFRDKGWALRVPRSLKEIAVSLPKKKNALTIKLGRIPTTEELAEYMKVSEEELLNAMESGMAYGVYSLDQTYEEDGEPGEGSRFEKYTSFNEDGYEKLEDIEIINTVLSGMGTTDKFVFRQRFVEEKSQAEIAKALGVSQMTISRIEKRIKKLFADELAKE